MSAVQPASVEHRLTAEDKPSPTAIREVLEALSEQDWQILADPPSRLPRIRFVQSQQRPSGVTLRSWFFSPANDEKLARQLSYYSYSLWKALGASDDLRPAMLGSDEPRLPAVEDFLTLSEQRLGHVGPRMAYLGLASRYGTGSKAALAAWRVIEPMQLLAPADEAPEPSEIGAIADGAPSQSGEQLLLGEDLAWENPPPTTTPVAPAATATGGATATLHPDPTADDARHSDAPGAVAGQRWAVTDIDPAAIDPSDAAEIAAHDAFTAAERLRLTALLEGLRVRSPHAQAAAAHAVETVTLGRAVPTVERDRLDDWSASLDQATEAIRSATDLEPRESVASLNAAVQTWLAHRDDVGQAMREAAANRKVIEHLEMLRDEREANLATIGVAYRGASPQVREALTAGLASAQSELSDVVDELERAVAHQEGLHRRRTSTPVLAPDAAVPLDDPDTHLTDALTAGDDDVAPTGIENQGLQWWHRTWSAVLLVGSFGLGIAMGGSAGMDRLGWSMAALTWWALIGPVVVLNAPARWRWTAAVGLALVGGIFATWAYQTSAVCGMTSMVAAFATVPVGLGFTGIAVWWQARRHPGEPRSGESSWLLAVTWFVFAFALVFLMSVLTAPINCIVG